MTTDNPRMRVKEIKWIKAGDLKPHPMNWRNHPEHQRKALRGVLQEIGFAGVLLAVERDGELLLVDGHLRRDEASDLEVPVAILDLDDAEAEKALVTLDPIAAMAQADKDQLMELLVKVQFEDGSVNAMLEAIANDEFKPLVDFTEGVATPDQDKINKRDKELREMFSQINDEYEESLVDIPCPDCGSIFKIKVGEFLKKHFKDGGK
jgi:hypothetical protein